MARKRKSIYDLRDQLERIDRARIRGNHLRTNDELEAAEQKIISIRNRYLRNMVRYIGGSEDYWTSDAENNIKVPRSVYMGLSAG